MRTGTLVFLVVVVGVLGFLYFKRSTGENGGGALIPVRHPLLVGFAPQRVSSIHVDNLERGVQIGLGRDAAGRSSLPARER